MEERRRMKMEEYRQEEEIWSRRPHLRGEGGKSDVSHSGKKQPVLRHYLNIFYKTDKSNQAI